MNQTIVSNMTTLEARNLPQVIEVDASWTVNQSQRRNSKGVQAHALNVTSPDLIVDTT